MPLASDRSIIRFLAEKVAEIAALPVQKETADEWKRSNSMKVGRPLFLIREIPWHEMNVNDELTLKCEDEFCRGIEQNLRTKIYSWEHVRDNAVIEPVFLSPLAISYSGFGISTDEDLISQSDANPVYSHAYHNQIQDEKDLERLHTPTVGHDEKASERTYQQLCDLMGDILEIRKTGIFHWWFSPWDQLVEWWGVENAMMDLVMRPELVHMFMDKLVNAYLGLLSQLEEQSLLCINYNWVVGSGGLGITDELPQPDIDPAHVRPIDQWGCSTAQIFSSVSPEMHEEFALQYERRWLEKFGITYYGCCEPLHNKLDILASIPNLRKVSMSPWANLDIAADQMRDKYVVSYKPNPAIFATDEWHPEQARLNLEDDLKKLEGCVVEVITKDISTVRGEPQRLWEWSEIVRDAVEEYA